MLDQPYYDVQVPYYKNNGDNYEFVNFLDEIVPPYPGDESVFDSPFPSPQYPKPETEQHHHQNITPPTAHLSNLSNSRTFYNRDCTKIKPEPLVRPEDYLTPIGYRPRSHQMIQDENCKNMTFKPKFSSEKHTNTCSDLLRDNNPTKPNRKRKVISPSFLANKIKTEQDSISLSREELLSFSSEQFEDFVIQITAVRDLTQSEKKRNQKTEKVNKEQRKRTSFPST